jgi:hypothetical protein
MVFMRHRPTGGSPVALSLSHSQPYGETQCAGSAMSVSHVSDDRVSTLRPGLLTLPVSV